MTNDQVKTQGQLQSHKLCLLLTSESRLPQQPGCQPSLCTTSFRGWRITKCTHPCLLPGTVCRPEDRKSWASSGREVLGPSLHWVLCSHQAHWYQGLRSLKWTPESPYSVSVISSSETLTRSWASWRRPVTLAIWEAGVGDQNSN